MPSLLQPVRLRWIVLAPIFLVFSALLGLFTTSALPAPEHRFRPALPGYVYRFPWDLGSHDEFQTEWWYYTGHLLSADQHRYGYQLTFFRRAVSSEAIRQNPSRWATRNIYFAISTSVMRITMSFALPRRFPAKASERRERKPEDW